MSHLSDYYTEYFIAIKIYPYGVPLKCNDSTISDGKIVVCNPWVKSLFK